MSGGRQTRCVEFVPLLYVRGVSVYIAEGAYNCIRDSLIAFLLSQSEPI